MASGDPLPNSVILWARLVSDTLDPTGGIPAEPVPVAWEVATDEKFDSVVASGFEVAEPALGHSVHADASDLLPDTWYWYRFSVGDAQSPVARTRTMPADDATPTSSAWPSHRARSSTPAPTPPMGRWPTTSSTW